MMYSFDSGRLFVSYADENKTTHIQIYIPTESKIEKHLRLEPNEKIRNVESFKTTITFQQEENYHSMNDQLETINTVRRNEHRRR